MATRGAIAQRDLPRQKSPQTQHDDRLELVHLATTLSEQAAKRQRVAPRVDDAFPVIQPFPTRRRQAPLRRMSVPLMLAVAAAVIVLLATSLTKAPAAPAPPASTPPVPVAATQPMSTAQLLGQAAGRRLRQVGGTVDEFICQAAYTDDAASAANALPPASAGSSAQTQYLAACMSGK